MDRFPLAQFNAETLSDVIQWIEFRDILRLYCTGDSSVIGMLKQPSTIREVHITRQTDVDNAVKFPNFCSLPIPDLSRQVTRLHIEAYQYTNESAEERSALFAGMYFSDLIPSFHLLSNLTLKRLIVSDDVLIDGLKLPDALTSLTICEVETQTRQPFCSTFVHKLPRGLLYLAIQEIMIVFNDECAQHLPTGLTTLILSSFSDNLTNAAIPLLPRSLTFLELFENTTIDDHGIEYLPPHLTHLGMSSNTSLTDHAIQHLPTHLTHLDLYWNINLTDRAMPLLPRTLKSLDLDSNDLISNEGVSHLPPCLTYLSMSYNTRLTSECFIDLPRGLTWLDIANTDHVDGEDIALLPRTLTHLDLDVGSHYLNDYDIPNLPRQLQYLDIASARFITDACIPHLPPTLTRLDISDADITIAGASQLLKRIKHDSIFLPYHLEIVCKQPLDNKQDNMSPTDTNLRVVDRLFMCCHAIPILAVHVIVAIAICVYFLM